MAAVVICSSYFRCAAWAVAAMRWHDAADGQRTNNVPFAAMLKLERWSQHITVECANWV